MKSVKSFLFILLVLLSVSCKIVKNGDLAGQQNGKIRQRNDAQSLVVWDSKTLTGGKGWLGKGEDAAFIRLDEPNTKGKKVIHYHNKLNRYLYSIFGWQWAQPQDKAVNLEQYDAVSFDIKVTGPQKPQQSFFTVTELNPAPVPLGEYDSSFADGSWHRISIPIKDMIWRGASAVIDRSAARGFDFMTFVWDAAEFDIQLDHFTFDHGVPTVKPLVTAYTPPASPQLIPGRIECAFYDAGGEGVAYHDTDPVNILSGVLNQKKDHQRPHASSYYWNFRKDEGVDISYTKDFADFTHINQFNPPVNQLYIGGASNGEWCNYTVNVQKSGTYKIIALYGNGTGGLRFSINNKPNDSECKFPITTGSAHSWARAEIGTITFPKAGVQVLTMHYNNGNNLAYLEFVESP